MILNKKGSITDAVLLATFIIIVVAVLRVVRT